MRSAVTTSDLESLALDARAAAHLGSRVNSILERHPGRRDPETQVRLWLDLRRNLLEDTDLRGTFPVHAFLYRLAYEERLQSAGPGPAWLPPPDAPKGTHIGELMAELGLERYEDLREWSVRDREGYWAAALRHLGIAFRKEPQDIRDPRFALTQPSWLPGAELNVAESCLRANPSQTAILFASEGDPTVRRMTHGELRQVAGRVAGGLERMGLARNDRIAMYMPMTPEAVAIYLGTILSGRAVVGVADASAPPDLEKRVRIGGAKAVFTIDAYVRDGKEHSIYDKVLAAAAPRTIVLPREHGSETRVRREGDLAWEEFLPDDGGFEPVPCRPSDLTNVLFSSGTTKDPKAIPWTHTTPIKAAADAHFHHDIHEDDVLAWPTSFGWMMGPWLTYASLINGAAMALYLGGPLDRGFGAFVQDAGVTMLGVVPKIVSSWREGRTMEGLDWSRIRRFSSTGETSNPEDMLYLMALAGYKPVIEYCGGTEVGGGYITGTMVQPCAPSAFSTPALGLDFVILDEGTPADRGEVFLVPPSIGLSNGLLNYDHAQEYFAGVPPGPNGEVLRRHGDQVERLGGGYYRHHGRIDDMVNIRGVKSSAEEIRSVLAHDLVSDAKPVAVDLQDSGQHSLVIYAVPRDPALLDDARAKERLRRDFQKAIKDRLNPLLAHVDDVVLVRELPQAGPGKTKTMKELRQDYLARIRRG